MRQSPNFSELLVLTIFNETADVVNMLSSALN